MAKVQLKSGEEQWIFIHIEVQSYHDSEFATRMFAYYYRIWDRYGIDIIALAIFTSELNMPLQYEANHYGTKLLYKYNHYYVKDQDAKELLKTENVFGLIVLANLYTISSRSKINIHIPLSDFSTYLALKSLVDAWHRLRFSP